MPLLAIIAGIAMILSLFILSLPLVDALITDAGLRWAFFLLICVFLALLLLRITYPKRRIRDDRSEETQGNESIGPVRRMASIIKKGMDGDPVSQIAAYSELRKIAIRRVSVQRRMPREVVESLLADKDRIAEVVLDDDIANIITTDFNRASSATPLRANSKDATSFIAGFKSLIGKVEDWE